MDFSKFDGNDALHWVFNAEQFFDYYDISDSYRLKIDAIHFEGQVVPWFQMLQKSGTITSWNALAQAVELAYGPSVFQCPQYALFKLSQIGSVTDYYAQFNALPNRVKGLSTTALLNCFLRGLSCELQRDVLP